MSHDASRNAAISDYIGHLKSKSVRSFTEEIIVKSNGAQFDGDPEAPLWDGLNSGQFRESLLTVYPQPWPFSNHYNTMSSGAH